MRGTFHNRYFKDFIDYQYIASFHDLVQRGYLSFDQLKAELSPDILRLSPTEHLVLRLKEHGLYMESEAEIRTIIEQIQNIFTSNEVLTDKQIFTLLNWLQIGSAWLKVLLGEEVSTIIRARLDICAKNLNESFMHNEVSFFRENKDLVPFIEYYENMINSSLFKSLQGKILKIFENGSETDFYRLINEDRRALRPAISDKCLLQLEAIMKSRPRVFFRVLSTLLDNVHKAPEHILPNKSTGQKALKDFVSRLDTRSDLDKMDRRRLDIFVRQCSSW